MISTNEKSLEKALIEACKNAWIFVDEPIYVIYNKRNNNFSVEKGDFYKGKNDFIVAVINPNYNKWKQSFIENQKGSSIEKLKRFMQFFQEKYLDTLVEKVSITVEKINNNNNIYEVIQFML